MKLFHLCTRAVALGVSLTTTRIVFTSGSTVTVKEVNEDPGCTGRTKAIYSAIYEDSCSGGVMCTTETGWTDSGSSEYKFCNYDRAGYLRYAFPNVQYLLFEYYEDESCKNLMQSSVILADGKCHSTVHYTLTFQTDEDGTVYVLSRGIDCDRGVWSNFTEPVPKDMINTGACFVGEHTIAKVYLVNGSATSTFFGSGSNSGSTTNTSNGTDTANVTTSSSPSLVLQTSSVLVLTALAAMSAIAIY